MGKRPECPVCRYSKKVKAPPLMPVHVRDENGDKKKLMMCRTCLILWLPEEITASLKKRKRKKN